MGQSSLSGGAKIVKYLVFIFNFLFFLIGLALLGLGIYAKVGKTDYYDVASEIAPSYLNASNLMVAIGVLIVIVSFMGCCGAFMENSCMLLAFFILLFLIFALEVAGCGLAYAKRDDLSQEFIDAVKKDYVNGTNANNALNDAIDEFQTKFKCCGYNGYKDWMKSTFVGNTGKLPASCCLKKFLDDKTCPTSSPELRDTHYYSKGCFKEVADWVKDNMYAIGSAAIAFAIIQILGMVFAMMLYCAIRKAGTVA